MKKIRMNQIIQIVANVAVIVGIVILIVEVRLNREALRLQSYQSWVAANLELNIAATDPEKSKILVEGNLHSSNLTSETYVSFAMWNMGIMQMAQSIDYMYRSGALDKKLWQSEINRASGFLRMPGVKQWWDAGGKSQLTPSFVELMESTESTIDIWTWDQDAGFIRYEGIIESQ